MSEGHLLMARVCDVEAKLHRLHAELAGLEERLSASKAPAEEVPHFVYLIIDPVEGRPVYVGMTTNIVNRMSQHRTDPSSAVFVYFSSFEEKREWSFVEVGVFANYTLARQCEESLIATIPGLANRDVEAVKARVPLIDAGARSGNVVSIRRGAMSNAEKQRAYRARLKAGKKEQTNA